MMTPKYATRALLLAATVAGACYLMVACSPGPPQPTIGPEGGPQPRRTAPR